MVKRHSGKQLQSAEFPDSCLGLDESGAAPQLVPCSGAPSWIQTGSSDGQPGQLRVGASSAGQRGGGAPRCLVVGGSPAPPGRLLMARRH